MRLKLLYNPRLLIERLAIESERYRRLGKLKGTVASNLKLGHIDSLELLEIARDYFKDLKFIYDIGANVGTWSLLAKAIFPNAVIHAFEPLSMHLDGFNKNTSHIADIMLHQLALGSQENSLVMQVASFSDASSLLEIAPATYDAFGITKEREEIVKVVVLDDFVTQNNIPFPDLIKLDIQGYELEALKGALKCLNSAKCLIIEVSFIEFYHGQPLFHEVVEFLYQHNFYLCAFGANTPLAKEISQCDALFIRKY
ncbi:MAG: FkbM family methyltransferase [Pseudanabaena sp. ELA607]|jgi:FkbM family methyltransferase